MCCALDNETNNNYFYHHMKKNFPRKHMFKMQVKDILSKSEQYFQGQLILMISEEESFKNIRILINLKFIKYIFVYSNDEKKIEKILLNSSKYIGYSKDFRQIMEKIEEITSHKEKKGDVNKGK